jgi:hypothetical protein
MRKFIGITACVLVTAALAGGASKAHLVALGKWTAVKLLIGDDESTHGEVTSVELKIRPLLVDGRTKEFTTGAAHDVTERMFVVQRAYRLNDLLPDESGPARWQWQRGGWMLVDRISGKVQSIALPAFDAYASEVKWFRDYAAYCGVSDDASKVFALVIQLGRRKPLLKKAVEAIRPCAAPLWARTPIRVTFDSLGEPKFTFKVRTLAVDLVTAEDEEAGEN